jgi:hypothetical protein
MVVSPTGRSATIAPSSAAGAVGGEPQTSGAYLAPPVPWLGPVRVTLLIALIQTPHRFRTRRQLWAYSGPALETRVSGEYRVTGSGQLQRANRQPSLRGLNQNHNHELKALFKSTATRAITAAGPFGDFYAALLATGMRPTMARLTVAQDRGHRFDHLEERRTFRSRTTETASSLSACENAIPPKVSCRWSVGFAKRSGSRASIQ